MFLFLTWQIHRCMTSKGWQHLQTPLKAESVTPDRQSGFD
jgi:hypothetical protein